MRVVFGQSQGKKRKLSPNEGRVRTVPAENGSWSPNESCVRTAPDRKTESESE
jgi:hypothetical protein